MPFNGSGLFTPLTPEYPAVSGTVIYADDWNNILDDLAAGLSLALATDGQSLPTANISWGGFLLRSLGNGTLSGDAVNYGQVFNSPTFQTPTLVSGVISADPASTDISLKIPSTAWVVARVTGPVYSAAVNLYLFNNY